MVTTHRILGFAIAATLAGALLAVRPAVGAETRWPGAKAGEPGPKGKGVPAGLAQ